jgi:hypothetical protein
MYGKRYIVPEHPEKFKLVINKSKNLSGKKKRAAIAGKSQNN